MGSKLTFFQTRRTGDKKSNSKTAKFPVLGHHKRYADYPRSPQNAVRITKSSTMNKKEAHYRAGVVMAKAKLKELR